MKNRFIFIGLVIGLLWSHLGVAATVTLKNMRMWHAPDSSRLVFDLSAPLNYKVSSLTSPLRIYIDFEKAKLSGPLPASSMTGPFVKRVRAGYPDGTHLRIVLDLKKPVDRRSFLLKPNKVYGHRLVVDLLKASKTPKSISPKTPAPKNSDFIIVLDPGHGGEDFGASGRRGTREKDVVLSIARQLKAKIDSLRGMRARLTRSGDYYISLRRRTEVARRHKADLFISIHADSFPKRHVRGSSVYTLSPRGASSETARWLADKENAADLVGGVNLKDMEDLLAQVLIDLAMTKTISDSIEFASDVLGQLGRVGTVHSKKVEQAGFVVLKSPDIPSILVETAFISNPTEEKLLRSRSHQKKIVSAMLRGVQRYVTRNPKHSTQQVGDRSSVPVLVSTIIER